jgi:hypothetical protein
MKIAKKEYELTMQGESNFSLREQFKFQIREAEEIISALEGRNRTFVETTESASEGIVPSFSVSMW